MNARSEIQQKNPEALAKARAEIFPKMQRDDVLFYYGLLWKVENDISAWARMFISFRAFYQRLKTLRTGNLDIYAPLNLEEATRLRRHYEDTLRFEPDWKRLKPEEQNEILNDCSQLLERYFLYL
jgi:hypothetical protein